MLASTQLWGIGIQQQHSGRDAGFRLLLSVFSADTVLLFEASVCLIDLKFTVNTAVGIDTRTMYQVFSSTKHSSSKTHISTAAGSLGTSRPPPPRIRVPLVDRIGVER